MMNRKVSNWYDRLLSIFLTMLGFGGATSCSYPAAYGGPPEDYHLIVSPVAITLPAEGGKLEHFTISTDGKWAIENTSDYLHITPQSGEKKEIISVSADDNKSPSSRQALITIQGETNKANVTVVQKGANE